MLSEKYLAKARLIRLKKKIIRDESSKHLFLTGGPALGEWDQFCVKCQCDKKSLDDNPRSCKEMRILNDIEETREHSWPI
jgi:hypothetical protein